MGDEGALQTRHLITALDEGKFVAWRISVNGFQLPNLMYICMHMPLSEHLLQLSESGKIQNTGCFSLTLSLAILSAVKSAREWLALQEGCSTMHKTLVSIPQTLLFSSASAPPVSSMLMLKLHLTSPQDRLRGGLRVPHDDKQSSSSKMQRS